MPLTKKQPGPRTSCDRARQLALIEAAKRGDDAAMRSGISEATAEDLSAKGTFARTALHWAVIKGHAETAQILLEAGVNKEAMDGYDMTPLHYAAYCRRPALAAVLLDHGCKTSARDILGKTPSDIALDRERRMVLTQRKVTKEVVRLLNKAEKLEAYGGH